MGEPQSIEHDKINLGCGQDYREGWHNVDLLGEVNPDETADLTETPWPWDDDSFEEVLMLNVIEHLENQLGALNELARITKPGGRIELAFPHPMSRSQWTDPTHARTIHPETFEHELVPDWDVVDVSASTVRFGRLFDSVGRNEWALWWADHLGFIVDECRVVLRA